MNVANWNQDDFARKSKWQRSTTTKKPRKKNHYFCLHQSTSTHKYCGIGRTKLSLSTKQWSPAKITIVWNASQPCRYLLHKPNKSAMNAVTKWWCAIHFGEATNSDRTMKNELNNVNVVLLRACLMLIWESERKSFLPFSMLFTHSRVSL